MTPRERTIHTFEKSPFCSKKFIAFLIGEITWKAIIAYMVYADVGMVPILSTILIAGFVEVGFILGQASLDKFVRGAVLMADKLVEAGKDEGSGTET